MTIPLPVQSIRETNGNGVPVACGAIWPEVNAARIAWAVILLGGGCTFGYAFINDVLAGRIRMQSHDVVLALIIVSAIVISCRVILRGVRKRRAIVFHVDGTIATPRGFAGNEYVYEMVHDCSDIVSIEAAFNKEYQWEVLVYFEDGHVFTWTQFLAKYDAHFVAVALTGALRDIRQAAARQPGGASTGAAGTRLDEAAYIVID